ncbi:MAG: 3-dehydroquinate synthase [Alphaproteobacteria bacterium]
MTPPPATTPGPAPGPDRLEVALGLRAYDIVIGPGALALAGSEMVAAGLTRRAHVVTDSNVAPLHLAALRAALDAAGIVSTAVTVPAGEETKTFDGLQSLLTALLDNRIERRDCVVALGGGVVGDLAGLAASLVLRGVDYVQVPTTLLAQVDSSVGGKTAIDTPHGKNLVGAFYQPRLVVADTDVLDTLPRRELLAGYAETAKYGVLGDATFFAWLERNAAGLLAGDAAARIHAVRRSCEMKAAIVAADERETGDDRALLNLGHTFAHAFEAATGFGAALLHGEAVAAGMAMACELSARLGLCPPEDAARVRRHLASVGLPAGLPPAPPGGWDAETLVRLMGHDKKVEAGRIRFILVRGIGKAFVARDVPPAVVASLLADAAQAA